MPSKKKVCFCGKLMSPRAEMCIRCRKKPENNPAYKDGMCRNNHCECGKEKRKKSKYCTDCSYKKRKGLRDTSKYLCECGKKKTYTSNNCYKCASAIKKGKYVSHNKSKSSTYNTWTAMKQRCNNGKNPNYKNYGARGIFVCSEWDIFENFLNDMGMRPEPHLTLERINNDDGYYKKNCKWATRTEQNLNKRYNLKR